MDNRCRRGARDARYTHAGSVTATTPKRAPSTKRRSRGTAHDRETLRAAWPTLWTKGFTAFRSGPSHGRHGATVHYVDACSDHDQIGSPPTMCSTLVGAPSPGEGE